MYGRSVTVAHRSPKPLVRVQILAPVPHINLFFCDIIKYVEFILASFWIIIFAFVLSLIAKKLRIPRVVAFIVTGLIFDIPFLKENLLDINITGKSIAQIGDFALIALMFLAGLETSTKDLLHERKEGVIISLSAAIIPFLTGLLVFKLLGFSLITSLIVGVSMSITAEATTAALLLELKKMKTRIGTLMMETGIIDDILGLSLFVLITFILKDVHLKEDILVSGAILAFFIGIILQHRLNHSHFKLNMTKKYLFILVIPFFFVSMGLHFDLNSLWIDPKILVIIILIAFFGKMFGTFLAKPFTNLSWPKIHLIGWAMNSRGAIELALVLIALRTDLITVEIYSGLVIMALVTTILFPFVATHIIRKNPHIMD